MLFDKVAYQSLTANILEEMEASLENYDKQQVCSILQAAMDTKPQAEAYVCGTLISIIDEVVGRNTIDSFDFKQSRYAYDVLSTAVDCIMMVL